MHLTILSFCNRNMELLEAQQQRVAVLVNTISMEKQSGSETIRDER